jgi:hypothetical protein
MAELIHEHATHVRALEGPEFMARTYREERSDGTWIGWLEFAPIDDRVPKLRTDRETSHRTGARSSIGQLDWKLSTSKGRLSALNW